MSEAKTHRQWAVELYNKTWELLEDNYGNPWQVERTAFASLYHWTQAGGPTEIAIGEWMLSRVYIRLGLPEEALRHAGIARAEIVDAEVPDWLPASVAEAGARALAANGSNEPAIAMRKHAYRLLENIADPEDRAHIASQLEDGPCFGLENYSDH